MVHQTQVKSAAYEFVVEFQSLLIHFDSFLIEFLIVLVSLLKDVLRLALISQSFRVPQFWVVWSNLQRPIVILVSGLELLRLPIQEYIAAVKIDCWVRWIFI